MTDLRTRLAETLRERQSAGVMGVVDLADAVLAVLTEADLKTELAMHKFRKKYYVDDNGCWIWTGAIDERDGYSHFYDGSGVTRAGYRFSWEYINGPIPNDLVVDHICRVRACVNPTHMRLVTSLENVMCGEAPSAKNKRKTACRNGHVFTVESTYVDTKGKRYCRPCTTARKRRSRIKMRSMTIGDS